MLSWRPASHFAVPRVSNGNVIDTPTARSGVIAVVSGGVTGIAAGFIGVGGGEFRIPVLVQLLGFPLKLAGGTNLVVGLLTVALGILRRWGQYSWTRDDVVLLWIMGLASVMGAGVGVLGRERLPLRPLKATVCVYLIVIGLWMLYESVAHVEHVLLEPTGITRWSLGAVMAFAIAVVSGVLGVAGGEMRIPTLLYLFAVPIREAGTLSLMISIPTVLAAAITDRRLGGIPNSVLPVALLIPEPSEVLPPLEGRGVEASVSG